MEKLTQLKKTQNPYLDIKKPPPPPPPYTPDAPEINIPPIFRMHREEVMHDILKTLCIKQDKTLHC